jgi:hypothetical protein
MLMKQHYRLETSHLVLYEFLFLFYFSSGSAKAKSYGSGSATRVRSLLVKVNFKIRSHEISVA